MKTIWLLWWMSWESSLEYYRIINEEVKKRLWWLNSGKILMHSVNFDEIEKLQHEWKWDELTQIMINNAQSLEKWWADFILICTNTMHKMAWDIEKNINIPLLHIASATADEINNDWLKKIWLLWTKFTMEHDFYKWKLIESWLEVIIPDENDRDIIHKIIYNELCLWKIKEDSKKEYLRIIKKIKEKWIQGVILWCTEIWLLIKQSDTDVKTYDTTLIHAISAVDYSLNN